MASSIVMNDYIGLERVSRDRRLLVTLPTPDEVAHKLVPSSDGRRLVYAPDVRGPSDTGTSPRAHCLVREDGSLVDLGLVSEVEFSLDGSRLAYVLHEGPGRVRVVAEDARGETFDSIRSLELSPDGRRIAYAAKRDGRDYVVVDGSPTLLPGPCTMEPGFSPEGSRFACIVETGPGEQLFLDGRLGPEFPSIASPVFSPDGRRIAYLGDQHDRHAIPFWSGKSRVVVDDQVFGPFRSATRVEFSPDGRSWACGVKEGACDRILRDGRKTAWDENIMGTWFLPSGALVLDLIDIPRDREAKVETTSAVMEGPWRGLRFYCDDPGWVSPDGRSVGIVRGEEGAVRVFRDERPGPLFANAGWPTWSPDGSALAYIGYHRGESGRTPRRACPQSVVVGEAQGEAFDRVHGPLRMVDARTVAFTARRGREIWWEVWKPGG